MVAARLGHSGGEGDGYSHPQGRHIGISSPEMEGDGILCDKGKGTFSPRRQVVTLMKTSRG